MPRLTKIALGCGAIAVCVLATWDVLARQAERTPAAPSAAAPARSATVPRPPLSAALKALDAAVASATQAGISLSCAVVDVHGDAVALVRMDEAGFLTVSLAQGKALVAALFGRPSDLGPMAASPFFASVNASLQGRMVPARGAVPIVRDGRVIGAVGCSGGAPAQDEAAAKAALAML